MNELKKTFFNIIVVSYNAGDKLIDTIESIRKQSYTGYRILVKDGMSTDGSIEKLKSKYDVGKDIILVESCDSGIYHAMNIAASYLEEKIINQRAIDEDADDTTKVKLLRAGEAPAYVFFLNCGDTFRDENVLRDVHDAIVDRNSKEGTTVPAIYYGDIFDCSAGSRIHSNPKIDDYACYRNLPSHQACFYDERLVYKNPFELRYKVRADYEQFLRCFYREKASTFYIPRIISDYEGGGFSDQNKKLSEQERREIIKLYLTGAQIRKYDMLRVLTLTKLRTAIAENKVTAGMYNKIKTAIYRLKEK